MCYSSGTWLINQKSAGVSGVSVCMFAGFCLKEGTWLSVLHSPSCLLCECEDRSCHSHYVTRKERQEGIKKSQMLVQRLTSGLYWVRLYKSLLDEETYSWALGYLQPIAFPTEAETECLSGISKVTQSIRRTEKTNWSQLLYTELSLAHTTINNVLSNAYRSPLCRNTKMNRTQCFYFIPKDISQESNMQTSTESRAVHRKNCGPSQAKSSLWFLM